MMMIFVQVFLSFVRLSVRPVRSFVRPWVGLAFIQICRRLFPSSVQERRIEWQFDRQC